jgi:hypothetical protein
MAGKHLKFFCFDTDLLAGMHVFQSNIRAATMSSLEHLRSVTTKAVKLLKIDGKTRCSQRRSICGLINPR